MRTICLVILLALVASGASFAADADIDVYTGMNLIGISRVPFDPAPWNVGGTGIFNLEFTNLELNGKLYRYDNTTGGYMSPWSRFNPSGFGNCLLGDAYWLSNTTGVQKLVTYAAVEDGVPDGVSGLMTDMWVSLPGVQGDGQDIGGVHMIGHPFEHNTPLNHTLTNGDGIWLTDGTELKTLKEAKAAGWCGDTFYRYNIGTGGYDTVAPRFATYNYLAPDLGYWFGTNKDNLALILPSSDHVW